MSRDRPELFVHLLPRLIPDRALVGGVVVVADVLRATTMMVHALDAGCEAVIPCAEIDEARTAAADVPGGKGLLGGERRGLPIHGFDLGNSPSSCTPEACRGRTLVMTTTNGTRAILASLEADRVLLGSFVNLRATVDQLRADVVQGSPVHVVCAGTEGYVSLEDTLLAGAIAADLAGEVEAGNDEATLAAAAWRALSDRADQGFTLAHALERGRGGRNVLAIGLPGDIEDSARIDRFDFAAELRREPLRIVAVS